MSLNSSTDDVSITLESIYDGPDASVNVFVYGAVTEKTGADSYDNGVNPHHNWRGWLLNDDDSGFQELTLTQGALESHTWIVPLSLVRAGGGNTQWENFWPVFALMDGPHTSYNEFLVATDPDMGPLIDVGILEFEVENTNQMPGFIPGDTLQISARVSNNGVEPYAEGGDLGVYLISGSDEVYLGGQSIGTIGVAGSFLFQIDFDTSDLDVIPSGVPRSGPSSSIWVLIATPRTTMPTTSHYMICHQRLPSQQRLAPLLLSEGPRSSSRAPPFLTTWSMTSSRCLRRWSTPVLEQKYGNPRGYPGQLLSARGQMQCMSTLSRLLQMQTRASMTLG